MYYETLVALVKLLTPIIPHTAEEVWEYIAWCRGRKCSINGYTEPDIETVEEGLLEKWNHFMKVRDDILKALEEARDEKIIGKSLEAKITIEPKDDQTKDVLTTIPNLHQMLIVSGAEIDE